ncbi:hypothetical protein [Candidatus Phytoplasma prunorum]|uniref:hypothetical protein n=1 Tax=Candidatus Phytoplasma prunorum TaxID=47565 RepID=UPI002FF06700
MKILKNKLKYPTWRSWLLLTIPLLSTIIIYGFLFPYYENKVKKDFYLQIQQGVNIPALESCQKFLKIEEIDSTTAQLETQLITGREFITRKTFLETKVPVLKNNTVTTKYKIYLDQRVQATETVKASVQNTFNYYLENQKTSKYINLSYNWNNDDRILIMGGNQPTSRELLLTINYQLDYEALKNDGIINNYLNQNQNTIQLSAEFGVQTEE